MLASIRQIKDVNPIPEADSIEVVTFTDLAWQCVVKKGEYKPGDMCIYIGVDSIVPERSEFEFLRKSNFRVKTIRLRKQMSQGLVVDPKLFGITGANEGLGADVTDALSIKKYEKPVPPCLYGLVKGSFPSFVPKTDEERIQNFPEVLNEMRGKPYYISMKYDGTSFTAYKYEGNFGVCMRNMELKEDDNNRYWMVAKEYKLQECLPEGFAIQAELCGPGIQKNRLDLGKHNIFVFNMYDIVNGRYCDFKDMAKFCTNNGLKFVKVIEAGENFDYTMEKLLEKADDKYPSGKKMEGIVIRPLQEGFSEAMRGRLSFKVLNNAFLLEEGE